MVGLTEYQLRRIRRASAADIAKMVDQERYWSAEVLHEIAKRIDQLNSNEPAEALIAGELILQLLERIRDADSDLRAFALAVHASTLRANGELHQALRVYEQALQTPNLSIAGQSEVWMKVAATFVALGELKTAFNLINAAVKNATDPIPAFAIRGWIQYLLGELSDALSDCMIVLDAAQKNPRTDYSMLSAVTTACNVLSFETGLNVPPVLFTELKIHIEELRKQFVAGGSGYRNAQFPRLMLSRAEALLSMREGRPKQAIAPLRRAVRCLEEKHPDQALASALDLVCAYAQAGRHRDAAEALKATEGLLKKMPYSLRPLTKNALRASIQSQALRYGEAVELRLLLRPHHTAESACSRKSIKKRKD